MLSRNKSSCTIHGTAHINRLGRCRPCWAAYMRQWNSKNPERVKASAKRFRKTDRFRNSHMKTKFGISLDEWNAKEKAQNGVCAICDQCETHTTKTGRPANRLSIDHCHHTGRVRSLLCTRCNTVLGLLDESPTHLGRVTAYVVAARASYGQAVIAARSVW